MSLKIIFINIKNLIKKIFTEDVHYVNGPESLPPPLDVNIEEEYIKESRNGNKKAKEILITHNLRLVVYIAKKFETTGINLEDLISIGSIGLIKAINTFQPDKKIKLATYASRCIENEILMYLRKTNNQKFEVSLEEPLNIDYDGNELLLSDVMGSDPNIVSTEIENEDERNIINKIVEDLPDREKKIMCLRYGLKGFSEHTQKEVADSLGISQSYISRLEKKIIEEIKVKLEKIY